jgi:ABC-type nitrate/sulfonate/bicarbonate transport system ATPase subunit
MMTTSEQASALPVEDDAGSSDAPRYQRLRLGRTASVDKLEAPAPTAIEICEVTRSFGDVRVISSVDLTIPPRTSLSIVGPSGCGKSTLLRMVAGLDEPSGGEIRIGTARTPKERLRQCAMMPQQDLLLPWRTALDNACVALQNRGVSRSAARRHAAPLFERFGLAAFEDALPATLSGGMRQRVSFLRTLLAGKSVMLLDEPFGALDAITRSEMQMWLINAMRDVPASVFLVTHDVEEAIRLGDRVAVMSARPARIARLIDIDIDRTQSAADLTRDPGYMAAKHDILEALAWS